MTTAPQSREFFRALESLRGIAALGVVLLHIAFAWTFPLYDLGFIRNGYLGGMPHNSFGYDLVGYILST
jgi:peptidoglycan/LPS O-acetylase OafA/YrhL